VHLTTLYYKNKVVNQISNTILKLFFYLTRRLCKAFAYKNGNIIIISLHKLGDTVFTIPAVREIQKSCQKKITILCYPETVSIYKFGLTNVEYCNVKHNYFSFGNRIASTKARKLLKKLKPEMIYDLTGVMTSASLIFNVRAKEIIGKNRDVFKPIYDRYSPLIFNSHLMDFYINAVSYKNSSPIQDSVKEFPIHLNHKKRILIHPFAGWRAKEWNLNKFMELAVSLKEDYEVALTMQSKTVTKDIVDEVMNNRISLLQMDSIDALIHCIQDSVVLIGNDSGPIQIASLLGKPTFSIYGPTNPEFHIPYGKFHEFCKSELKFVPGKEEKLCFTYGGRYGCPSFECMHQLSVDDVSNHVREFLNRVIN
jgi:heptosyltransferase-2